MTRRREPPKQKLLPLVDLSPRARRNVSAVSGVVYLLLAAGGLAVTLGATRDRWWHGALTAAFLVAAVGQFSRSWTLTRGKLDQHSESRGPPG